MLSSRIGFGTVLRRFNATNAAISKDLAAVLSYKVFDSIRSQSASNFTDLKEGLLASKLEKCVATGLLTPNEKNKIYNSIIEHLTKYDYSVAAKFMKKILTENHQLNTGAFIELIKYNPGRVTSSWELFVANKGIINSMDDSALNSILKKIVTFDKCDIDDGKTKMDINDVAKAFILLEKYKSFECLDQKSYESLLKNVWANNLSCCLSILRKFQLNLTFQNSDLTDFQLFELYRFKGIPIFENNPNLLVRLINLVSANKNIEMTELEKDSFGKFIEAYNRFRAQLGEVSDLSLLNCKTNIVDKKFATALTDEIINKHLDENNFEIAEAVLKSTNLNSQNKGETLNLFKKYNLIYKAEKKKLSFDMFLSKAIQAYNHNSIEMLDDARAYLSTDVEMQYFDKLMNVTILVLAKIDDEKALAYFNSNIDKISNEKDVNTNLSHKSIITESLLIGYLYNEDLEFARIIFENGVKQKIFETQSEIKSIKTTLSAYGEAVEKKCNVEVLDKIIKDRLFAL